MRSLGHALALFLLFCCLPAQDRLWADLSGNHLEDASGTGAPPDPGTAEPAPAAAETAPDEVAEAGALAQTTVGLAETEEEPDREPEKTGRRLRWAPSGAEVSVYVIPIHGEVSKPIEFILRRGVKQAISDGIDVIVLDINTPGGRLDVTLNLMEMLDNFGGLTVAYVNKEAISAGAYIASACDVIYMAPRGIIGAAAVVQATGQEIDLSMKQKIDSYLRAKVRSMTSDHRYRGDVIRAMMDQAFVLEIDGVVIKKEGELLTLTADEATAFYGDPPHPLLAEGVADSLQGLLEASLGEGRFVVKAFELTWSEELAKYMAAIAPALLGLGLLLLFIEFKTPGFGVFGVAGIALLVIVFLSNYVAGLAGHEPLLLFFLGVILVALELFVLPGVLVFGMTGAILILGALIWSMADIWPTLPNQGEGFDFSVLWPAVHRVTLGLLFAFVGIMAIGRFLPKTSVWSRLVLADSPPPEPNTVARAVRQDPSGTPARLPQTGDEGIAVTDLRPEGEVEIRGCRYPAAVALGTLRKGSVVEVVAQRDFRLLVKGKSS